MWPSTVLCNFRPSVITASAIEEDDASFCSVVNATFSGDLRQSKKVEIVSNCQEDQAFVPWEELNLLHMIVDLHILDYSTLKAVVYLELWVMETNS